MLRITAVTLRINVCAAEYERQNGTKNVSCLSQELIYTYICNNLQKYNNFLKRTICILLGALFCAFPLCAENIGLKTVVIDPGHGGTDPGAVSKDGKTYESHLTLDISQRLKRKINAAFPEVYVILTRDTDVFVPLGERARKANDAGAELFMSVHINASKSASPNGYSIHLLGKSANKDRDLFAYNMDVCKRENSVVMLEEDSSTTYADFDPDDPESFIFMLLMQSSNLEQSFKFAEILERHLKEGPVKADRGVWQNPFMVLWRTGMPAVLVELGFISNENDLSVLKKEDERDAIADKLFLSFKEYKANYDRSISSGD